MASKVWPSNCVFFVSPIRGELVQIVLAVIRKRTVTQQKLFGDLTEWEWASADVSVPYKERPFHTGKQSEEVLMAYYVKIRFDWQEHAARIYRVVRDALWFRPVFEWHV